MGVAAAGIASAVIGAGGSIGSSVLGSSKQKKQIQSMIKSQERIHEAEAATREKYSQMVRADQEMAQSNLLQAEQARLNVLTSLGQPGTYGPSIGDRSGPISLGVLTPTGLSGLAPSQRNVISASGTAKMAGSVLPEEVKLRNKPRFKGVRSWEIGGVQLDPGAMAEAVKSTAGFRTVSQMVAEAEQLMNRQGPLWDELNNSIVGGIYESNAVMQKQAMEQVARNMARGGTARRVGLQMAQAMQVQEGINRERTGQLWQAKLSLEEFRSNYAQQVTNFAQNWVNNASGIRDSFTSALTSLQTFWASTMAPSLVGATVQAQSATQQGIVNASQGLLDATATSANAAGGAFQGLEGIGLQVFGSQIKDKGLSSIFSSAGSGLMGGATSGGGTAAAAGAAGAACWCAAIYYPRFSPDWWRCRQWILEGWNTRIGHMFRALYLRYGERASKILKRNRLIRRLVKPLFVWINKKGIEFEAQQEL